MRIHITSYAPEARARIGEGARACDKGDWGFDLPEQIFETRPDGGYAIRGAVQEQCNAGLLRFLGPLVA